MTFVAATYTVHGWIAVLIVLAILAVIALGVVTLARAVKRSMRSAIKRGRR